MEKVVITILVVINIIVVFYYTARSSVRHNNRLIDWLKQNNDKSGHWMI